VRDLGPPEPLATTLERLVELDDGTVVVQLSGDGSAISFRT
jgi:hypothetical protein